MVCRGGDAGRYDRLWFYWRAGVGLKSWVAVVYAFAYCPVTLAGLVPQYLEHQFSVHAKQNSGHMVGKILSWLFIHVPEFKCCCPSFLLLVFTGSTL